MSDCRSFSLQILHPVSALRFARLDEDDDERYTGGLVEDEDEDEDEGEGEDGDEDEDEDEDEAEDEDEGEGEGEGEDEVEEADGSAERVRRGWSSLSSFSCLLSEERALEEDEEEDACGSSC